MLYLTTSQYYQVYLALTKTPDMKKQSAKEKGKTSEDRAQLNPGSVGV